MCLVLLPGCVSGSVLPQDNTTTTIPAQITTASDPTTPPSPTPTSSPTPTPAPPTPTSAPASGEQSAGDSYAPELGNDGYDVQQYILELELEPNTPQIRGLTTIQAISEYENLVQLSLDFAGFEISSLDVNNQPSGFQRQGEKLVVDLAQPVNAGELFEIQIAYAGSPEVEPSEFVPFLSHLGLFYPGDAAIFTMSEPDGAHHWYPCNDHPTDKARYRFEISIPEPLVAVANGVLVETRPQSDDRVVYVWEHDAPMAPYLSVVAVGDYVLLERETQQGIPVRNYIFPDLQDEFAVFDLITLEALDWIGELVGPYPFETFGFVTVRQVRAASETQSMVIIPDTMLNEETIVHEIAHMWFGDWVSLESWGDMWLKEGLAIYFSLLWQTRNEPSGLDIYMDSLTPRVLEKSSSQPLGDLPRELLYTYDSYWKGAVFQHALRKEIGDQAYFQGLRDYLRRYGGGTASRAEFQSVMESTAGKPLEAFFSDWLGQARP